MVVNEDDQGIESGHHCWNKGAEALRAGENC